MDRLVAWTGEVARHGPSCGLDMRGSKAWTLLWLGLERWPDMDPFVAWTREVARHRPSCGMD